MQFLLYAILPLMLTQLTSPHTTNYEVVKVGVIFFNDELDLVNAFDTAIRDINELEVNVRLQPLKHFVSSDDSLTLQELACELIDNGVAALFGPSSKASTDIVEVICNTTGIPHMQFDWYPKEIDRHSRNHKMTVNVAPTEKMLSVAYLDILRMERLNWRSFTIVYENSRSLARMQELFSWRQFHRTGIKLWQFNRGDDYRILWKRISNAREKNVVLDCPSDIVNDVMNASIYFNMTGQFNYWFFTSLDTHMSNISALYSEKFLATVLAVRMRPFIPPPVHSETDVFADEEEEQLISSRSKLIYDAVVLFFNAVRHHMKTSRYQAPKVRCQRGVWYTGPQLLDQMKILTSVNVTPHYKTQKMRINEYGERDDFNLEVYDPMVERITHIWNKYQNLVRYEDIVEARELKKSKLKEKEDLSPKRKKYTVSTRIGEPYFMWRKEPEGIHYEGNLRFEGYAVDLIYSLAEECEFDFVFEPVPDNKYGSFDPITGEWNGIIKQLIDKTAEIGICDLTITQARRSVVDFTMPFMQLGVSILFYKDPPPPPNPFGFFNAYSFDVWISLLASIIVTALFLVVLGRISLPDWFSQYEHDPDPSELQNIWNFSNTLWLNVGSILNQGCDILPRGPATRIFTACWWIFALILSQTYIAKMSAFITSSQRGSAISSLRDLIEQNKVQFGMLKGGSTSFLFSESNESEYRLAWNKMTAMKPSAFTGNNKEGVDRVKRSRGRYAFLLETTTLQYYLNRNCELKQIGESFSDNHYGIAVPLDAPYRSNLSVGILRLSETGKLDEMKRKWFATKKPTCDRDSGNKGQQFTMEAASGLFIVLTGGVVFSFLIGIFEFLKNVQEISVKELISPVVVLKSELMFFFCFWKTRKPLRTYADSRSSTSTGYSSMDRNVNTSNAKKKVKKKSGKRREQ